uniref:DUF7716 domain-containing protein n=2 Tax=Vibrio nigripulchritudo TaxID=28173 RepID=UPI002492556F|nr:hypothetical protein [Vibrio nigripulchritudo]
MMNAREYFGEPCCLSEWISRGRHADDGGTSWLVFADPSGQTSVQLCTVLFPLLDATEDFSDEEYDAFENSLNAQAYSYYLSTDQIEDVIYNRDMQRPGATLDDYVVALNHYFHHDAFLCL